MAISPIDNNTITTTLPPPPPLNAHVSYVCNGDAFGFDLDIDSCLDAMRYVGVSTRDLTFGIRNTGTFDIALPQRFISSDGKCVIEPSLTPGAGKARASPEDVAVASYVLVRNCASMEPSRGGIAKDIGGDDDLRVIVSKYDPENVRCYGKMDLADVYASCQGILNSMLTSEMHTFFGPGSDPLAGVRLPFLLVSTDRKCRMTIRTTGKGAGLTDSWSWGRFWENGVALVGMCVREGMQGVQTRLGENGHLYMEVSGPEGEFEANVTVA